MQFYKENLRNAIVRVEGKSRGTGFWIKGKDGTLYVLTCAHVAGEEGDTVELRFYIGDGKFGNQAQGIVLRSIPETLGDLALIQVAPGVVPSDSLPMRLLDIDFSKPPAFFAYGFPKALSEHGRFAEGGNLIGEQIQNNEGLPLCQLINAHEIRPGFSGGPLVHADLGFVVGLICTIEIPDENSSVSVSYAIPIRFITEQLAYYLDAQSLHPYEAWLYSLYDEVVMNDEKGMRLSDIYIEPFCRVHESCVNKEEEPYSSQKTRNAFYALDTSIHSLMDTTTKSGTFSKYKIKLQTPQLTLLLGYPGQGKTSFIKRLLRDHLAQPQHSPVYWVRLRYIHDSRELRDQPFTVIKREIEQQARLEKLVTDVQLEQALLLLDGLDELTIKSDMSSRDVDDIVWEIAKTAGKEYPRLRIVLTTRYGYLNLERVADIRCILLIHLEEFTDNQQLLWLERYRKFHPESHLNNIKLKSYQDDEKYKTLRELLSQPILLHMVASLEQDISDTPNRAAIYTKLFDQLVQRTWSKDGATEALRRNNPALLRQALRDIAHAIFHSEKPYLHKSSFDKLLKVQGLQRRLENNLDTWRSVMVAFYMDEARKSGGYECEDDYDYAVEFLHPSLHEYLCAEYIWHSILEEFGDQNPKSYKTDLENLHKIFGRKVITFEITRYLGEIIKNDQSKDKKHLAARFTHFFSDMLAQDFLPADSISYPLDTIGSLFYGYWTILSHLTTVKDFVTKDNELAILRLIRVLTQEEALFFDLTGITLHHANLNGLNLSGAMLSGARLCGLNLLGTNLSETYLEDVNLTEAKLVSVNLSDAYLVGAILDNATFFHTNLSGANLSNAILDSSVLYGSNLSHTNLDHASLCGVNLERSNLYNASLYCTNLHCASLEDANLLYANLEGANLQGAILEGAILQGVKLEEANLQGANLYGAKLSNANLRGTNLHATNLRATNLERAILSDADLMGADLSDANLDAADLSNSILINADLVGTNLNGVSLVGANLDTANLRSANLADADLSNANLRETILIDSNLSDTILLDADLYGANLSNSRGITLEQLQHVHTLYQCRGIPYEIETQLRQSHPHLFEEPING